MQRKNYIDNLRWLCILLLLPFHTAQLWNNWGSYYIWQGENMVLSCFVMAIHPWFMTLMFTLAGMSCRYALNKRTKKEYIIERIKKILIPGISGILFVIPVMTFYAEKFHNNYTGSFLHQYILFFTKETDLTGYHGGFTPAHLWFLFYLFLISLFALGIVCFLKRYCPTLSETHVNLTIVIFLFLPIWAMSYVLNIAGKSIGAYLLLFLLGYYILSEDNYLEMLEKHRWLLTGFWIFTDVFFVYLFEIIGKTGALCEFIMYLSGWLGILALLGLGKHFLNCQNKLTIFFKKYSFQIYVFHLMWIVVVGYYVIQWFHGVMLEFFITLTIASILTLLTSVIIGRIPFMRKLFGYR